MEDFTMFICFVMRTAMKKLERVLSAHLEQYGVSVPQSFVLFCLLEEDGSTLKEIGTRAQIDSSSMTVLVDELESEGLVERRLDQQDRRAIRVYLTDKGRQLGLEVLNAGMAFNQFIKNSLGELETPFLQGLQTIVKILE